MSFENNFKLFIKNQKDKGSKVIVPKFQGDNEYQQFFQTPEIPETGSARIIEGNKQLEKFKINIQKDVSGFSYFLDGIERKKVIILSNKTAQIPITFGYVSAAILKRTDKKMHSVEGLFKEDKSIYLPYKKEGNEPDHYLEKEDVEKFGINPVNIGIIDEKGKRKDFPTYPVEFEQMAHSAIQTRRGDFEKQLVWEWINKNYNDGWLFIDGRLQSVSRHLSFNSKVVGIIKSHRSFYFPPDEQFKIYSLNKDERTSIFIPKDRNDKEENVFSWYLRLHNNKPDGNVDFGIIRVEISAKDFSNNIEELTRKADLISKWILLERNPVAFPASRWDRMIYPIKYCEDYLKSKAPSYIRIESIA